MSNFKITFLVWGSGAHGLAIDINTGLLPHVDQDDRALLGVGLGHLSQHILISLLGGLATAVHLKYNIRLKPLAIWWNLQRNRRDFLQFNLVSWNTSEVRNTLNGVGKLLYFVKVICHQGSSVHICHLVCLKEYKNLETVYYYYYRCFIRDVNTSLQVLSM